MQQPPTIAIADDYEPLCRELSRMLRALGFGICIQATHGQDLLMQLGAAASPLPTLCLLDINMPVMDGYETARHLKELYPEIKVLAMSFDKEPQEIEKILQAGAHAFIFKDSPPDAFKEKLLGLCDGDVTRSA
ncbi:MAG: response regulator [Sphingobacteriales bacterium]|nr:MAG: response regulator [Sphingobacteriales bacterium]